MDISNSRVVEAMRDMSEVQKEMSENQRRLADALLETVKEVDRQKKVVGKLLTVTDMMAERIIMSETAIAMLISHVEDYDKELKNLITRVKALEANGDY